LVTAPQIRFSLGCYARRATVAALLLGCCGAQARVRGQAQSRERPSGSSPIAARPILARPGYLGVGLRDLDASEATRLHLHGAMGAEIVTVDRDAPAWTAGLRRGDIVIDFNGNPVDGLEDLRRRLRACIEGETVTMRVRHNGNEHTVAVTLGDEQAIAQQSLQRRLGPSDESPALSEQPQGTVQNLPGVDSDFSDPAPAPVPANASRGITSTLLDALIPASYYTGLEVNPLTAQLAAYFGVGGRGGLLVTAVSAQSPADSAGLGAGDVILIAGGKPVSSRSSLAHVVRASKGQAILLVIQRNRRELTLSLRPGRHRLR
jgi:serine protease Do